MHHLTSKQREQIRHETGDEVIGFTWEKLESRDAPRIGGGLSNAIIRAGDGPADVSILRGGGALSVDNPAE